MWLKSRARRRRAARARHRDQGRCASLPSRSNPGKSHRTPAGCGREFGDAVAELDPGGEPCEWVSAPHDNVINVLPGARGPTGRGVPGSGGSYGCAEALRPTRVTPVEAAGSTA